MNNVRLGRWRVLVAILIAMLASHAAPANEAFNEDPDAALTAVRAQLAARYPATTFGAIRPAPIGGLFEVMLGENIVYVDAQARYFLFGHVLDMITQRDLTAERLRESSDAATANESPGTAVHAADPAPDEANATRTTR